MSAPHPDDALVAELAAEEEALASRRFLAYLRRKEQEAAPRTDRELLDDLLVAVAHHLLLTKADDTETYVDRVLWDKASAIAEEANR